MSAMPISELPSFTEPVRLFPLSNAVLLPGSLLPLQVVKERYATMVHDALADDGIIAIGSGGPYALAAARALVRHSDLSAEEIVRESLLTAASICVYTNENITVETLEAG